MASVCRTGVWHGGGRRAELASSADKLLFILVYFRLYPTQVVQGFLFGLGQSQACEWIHKLSVYSGKKKRPSVTNVVISQRGGKILFLSDIYGGRVPDKAICDGEEYEFLEGSTLWQDTGFQGFALPGVTIRQPKKKPRNQSLTETDKQENQAISRERVEIEHQIGGIKRCTIVVHKFRKRTDYYVDDVMETACGGHNFRLIHRQLKVA